MEERGVQFYKLNRTRRYGVEGTDFRVGDAVLFGAVMVFFLALAIAELVINLDVLFRDTEITVFVLGFLLIVCLIIAIGGLRYRRVFEKRKHARRILKDCTLTDGTVTEVQTQKVQRYSTRRSYSYYAVHLKYSYYGTGGEPHCGEFLGSYGEVPFFVGQNLMIVFRGEESAILNRFALLDGAEEFKRAEAQREEPDFSGLTGERVKITKPVLIAEYAWSKPFQIAKHKKRLQQILNGNPQFAKGKFFIKKSTYRKNAGNKSFYCYLDVAGKEHVEECAGILNLKDGDEVTVAYDGDASEIIKI